MLLTVFSPLANTLNHCLFNISLTFGSVSYSCALNAPRRIVWIMQTKRALAV